jgi:hypothetical protein
MLGSFSQFFFKEIKKYQNELLFFREILITLLSDLIWKLFIQKLIIITPLLVIL